MSIVTNHKKRQLEVTSQRHQNRTSEQGHTHSVLLDSNSSIIAGSISAQAKYGNKCRSDAWRQIKRNVATHGISAHTTR